MAGEEEKEEEKEEEEVTSVLRLSVSVQRPADCSRRQVKCEESERRSVCVKLGAKAPRRGKRHSVLMSELEEKLRLSAGTLHSMLLYFYDMVTQRSKRKFQKDLVDASGWTKSEIEEDKKNLKTF